jgi:hypothetical protein
VGKEREQERLYSQPLSPDTEQERQERELENVFREQLGKV